MLDLVDVVDVVVRGSVVRDHVRHEQHARERQTAVRHDELGDAQRWVAHADDVAPRRRNGVEDALVRFGVDAELVVSEDPRCGIVGRLMQQVTDRRDATLGHTKEGVAAERGAVCAVGDVRVVKQPLTQHVVDRDGGQLVEMEILRGIAGRRARTTTGRGCCGQS